MSAAWVWRRRHAKPAMGTCEVASGVGHVLDRCAAPATHTVVGVLLLFPAHCCATCAATMVAQGYEAREGEWDARRQP